MRRIPASAYKIPRDKNIVALDSSLMQFPLKLRIWQEGDWFIPLGMNGKKKVSDFLIDQKVPLPLKKNVLVLTSGQSIAWILGYRPDNRYKVTDKTQQVLELRVEKKQ
jgi:tRNA(Ile)-lysidine synthase